MSFAVQKTGEITHYLTRLHYPLSYGRAVSVEEKREKRIVTFTEGKKELAKKDFKISNLPWQVCNPYLLIHQAASTQIRKDLEKLWSRIDTKASDHTSSLDYLGELIFLANEEDIAYYGIFLLCKKIKDKNFSKSEMPKAIEKLKWLIISAFAESDVPRIVFTNGYLLQLEKNIGLEEIEELFPGISTENLAGGIGHIIRF